MLTLSRIQDAVAEIAPQFSIHRVELFGSYASGRAESTSDVDVLIGKSPAFTLFDLCRFTSLLENKLGLPVDAVIDTPETTRDLIVDRKVTLYER